MQSFTQKEIEITVILDDGSFGNEGNTKIMRGYATVCQIEKVGLPDKNKAKIALYGIKQEDMEQMTTLAFLPLETKKNLVQIRAGEKESDELHVVFKGEITTAFANYNSAPNIAFVIEAMAGYFPALTAIPATTIEGTVEIANLLEKLTKQANYTFKNEGISGSCVNPYLVGSPIEQIKAIAKEHDIQIIIDDETVYALPEDGVRQGNTVFLSKDTGLIGYPTFTSDGVNVKCFYDNALELGGLIEIESIVPKASGTWKITKLNHTLSANITGDNPWVSEISGIMYN